MHQWRAIPLFNRILTSCFHKRKLVYLLVSTSIHCVTPAFNWSSLATLYRAIVHMWMKMGGYCVHVYMQMGNAQICVNTNIIFSPFSILYSSFSIPCTDEAVPAVSSPLRLQPQSLLPPQGERSDSILLRRSLVPNTLCLTVPHSLLRQSTGYGSHIHTHACRHIHTHTHTRMHTHTTQNFHVEGRNLDLYSCCIYPSIASSF